MCIIVEVTGISYCNTKYKRLLKSVLFRSQIAAVSSSQIAAVNYLYEYNNSTVFGKGLIKALTSSDDDNTTRSIRGVPGVLEMLLYHGI